LQIFSSVCALKESTDIGFVNGFPKIPLYSSGISKSGFMKTYLAERVNHLSEQFFSKALFTLNGEPLKAVFAFSVRGSVFPFRS
jgi:hypothetical protein